MKKYKVKITIEQWTEAEDENQAAENAKVNFEHSDLHYAKLSIEEIDK